MYLNSLYNIHNKKSHSAAKTRLSGKAKKETGKFPVSSCIATASEIYTIT